MEQVYKLPSGINDIYWLMDGVNETKYKLRQEGLLLDAFTELSEKFTLIITSRSYEINLEPIIPPNNCLENTIHAELME